MSRTNAAFLLVCAASLMMACADSTSPDDVVPAGTVTMRIQGPNSFELQGDAAVYPGLGQGTIERINLVSGTTNFVYRLEVRLSPALVAPRGPFVLGPGSAVQATFYVFDRGAIEYSQIAAVQSGTITLNECTLTRCVGTLTGEMPLGSTAQRSTITATFHARLQ